MGKSQPEEGKVENAEQGKGEGMQREEHILWKNGGNAE